MTTEQLTTLRKLAEAAKDAEFMTIAMQPAAILELIGTLERAVGVITKLSDIDCGCRPCREQCLSETALKIELQERMELCREFLASLEGGEK